MSTAQDSKHFIYVFDAVRPEMVTDPGAWTEEDIRTAEEHYAYLQRATQAGTVILAGRSLDGVGPAVVILEAASEVEARHFMEDDPFVAGGLMRASLHPFRAALVRSP
jgi:uncharacterized protein YciI